MNELEPNIIDNETETEINNDINNDNDNDNDSEDDSNSDIDSDFDEEYDFEIEDLATKERVCEDEYFETLHKDKQRYIGFALEQYDNYIYLIHITQQNYLKYPHEIVRKYMRRFSCIEMPKNANIEIIQMIITNVSFGDETFPVKNVVIKTHWIRLIQRCWRKVLQQRKIMIFNWASMRNRRHVELTGKNLPEYRRLPGLSGCLGL